MEEHAKKQADGLATEDEISAAKYLAQVIEELKSELLQMEKEEASGR